VKASKFVTSKIPVHGVVLSYAQEELYLYYYTKAFQGTYAL